MVKKFLGVVFPTGLTRIRERFKRVLPITAFAGAIFFSGLKADPHIVRPLADAELIKEKVDYALTTGIVPQSWSKSNAPLQATAHTESQA